MPKNITLILLQNQLGMFVYLKRVFLHQCPRCGQGNLFTHKWYQLGHVNSLKDQCEVCGQRTHLEPGFYHGTGYVSYALTVGLSIISFVSFYLITGITIRDARIFYWLLGNTVTLVLMQPWLMRLSRSLWLSWFFHDDDKFHTQAQSSNSKI